MNRKQNSLMRFSRTERLAQLSEQEIVIEKKKREIQAKLEAQKKKETEEAFKKLEFSKEIKSIKPGFSKEPWIGNDSKKNSIHEKPVEKVKESLTNAFSNDGTFLDQFKKLSQSKFEMQTPSTNKKIENEGSLSEKETNGKKDNDERGNPESLNTDKKTAGGSNPLSFIKNSSDSGTQSQTARVSQFPQPQDPSALLNVDSSKSTVPLLSNQSTAQHPSPGLYSGYVPLNLNQYNYSNTDQSKPFIRSPDLSPSLNSKDFRTNEPMGNSYSSTFNQPFKNTPEPSPVQSPSVPTSELPKVRSESISMTLKINPVKKLEAIPNPLDVDQPSSPDSLKKDQFNFSEKESSKGTFLNTPQNYRSTPIFESVSSHDKDSSRISSAFFNEDDDEEDENKDGGLLNDKHQHWASLVARCGDEFEDTLRSRNENDPDLRFLSDKNSKEYLSYRKLVLKYRMSLKSEEEPLGKSRKLNPEETDSGRSSENKFLSNKEFSKTKAINEDAYKGKDYIDSDGQQGSRKNSRIHENQINHDEYNNLSKSGFKGDCFSNSQKQSFPKGTSNLILKEGNNAEGNEQQKTEERRKRKRKSRWGDAEPTTSVPGSDFNLDLQPPGKLPAPKSTLLSQLTRSDPGLIQYARQTFGSTNLSEEDWKKAEDHYKINLLYQDMIKKRAEVEKLERQGKFKYEYDSDEDTEGGTWEHKLRQQEMQATQLWAEELTRQAAGKHHIGDFLPPEELERFMEKYNAVKEGREPDLSDYKEYKLKEDNVGYRLLQKMGWNEGQGLGQDGSGITNPVNKVATRHENQGLGVERPDGLEAGDDEYDAYRKRMMLAYRFRPNPLNNPRRPYY